MPDILGGDTPDTKMAGPNPVFQEWAPHLQVGGGPE